MDFFRWGYRKGEVAIWVNGAGNVECDPDLPAGASGRDAAVERKFGFELETLLRFRWDREGGSKNDGFVVLMDGMCRCVFPVASYLSPKFL